MRSEPDSISVPFPHQKTATIPLDVLEAYVALYRAVEADFSPVALTDGAYGYSTKRPVKTMYAWRILRELATEGGK